jgi:CRP-like cAMP-binding protein
MNITISDSIQLPVDSVIFREGEPANKMYLVKRGEIVCLKNFNDRLLPVYVARTEDILGESAVEKGKSYLYSAITRGPVELVEIPAEKFHKFFASAPGWLVGLQTTMLERYKATVELLAENRILHPRIIPEEEFTSAVEIEYKKLINKTE